MRQLTISRFRNKRDNVPQHETLQWTQLVQLLTRHSVRSEQDGPLWSPAKFHLDATRSKESSDSIDLFVIDIDMPCSLYELKPIWDEYEYVLHSTFSHSSDSPRYRVIFPLAQSVSADQWEEAWLRLIVPLSKGLYDNACKETCRMYFLPSCPADRKEEVVAEHHVGRWLSTSDFPSLEQQLSETHERPGDEYNRRTRWEDLLLPLGSEQKAKDLWVRPGKNPRNGHSARTGLGQGDLMHVFTSNWPPFEAGKSYTKFAAYALLEHDGDFSAAAQALKFQGYGKPVEKDEEKTRDSAATKLVTMVQQMGLRLYCSDQGTCYVQVTDPVQDLLKLNSSDFKDWLRRAHYRQHRKSVNDQAIAEAISILACEAKYETDQRIKVHIRVAGDQDTIWIDLGTPDRSVAKVTALGWEVVREAPVHFWRPRQMHPLPVPECGGRLSKLRDFVNVASDSDLSLLLAWLVMALHPNGPYPILVLTGQRGSAKSTTARVLKRLVDPSGIDLRNLSSDDKDLKAAAINSRCLVFDNLSKLTSHQSDNLCKLSTGGGISNRANYTDDEEAVFEGKRPIILTAIEDLVEKPDLVDRSLFPTLPVIRDYRTEEKLWEEFERVKGQLFGALLDALACGLRNLPNVKHDGQFRMADFARFAEAASPAFGLGMGFYELYARNRSDVSQSVADASPMCTAILQLVGSGRWEGSASELVAAMSEKVSEAEKRSIPVSSQVKSKLRLILPLLREQGIEYEHGRTGSRRWISFEKTGESIVTAVTAVTSAPVGVTAKALSEPGSDGGDSGDRDKEFIV